LDCSPKGSRAPRLKNRMAGSETLTSTMALHPIRTALYALGGQNSLSCSIYADAGLQAVFSVIMIGMTSARIHYTKSRDSPDPIKPGTFSYYGLFGVRSSFSTPRLTQFRSHHRAAACDVHFCFALVALGVSEFPLFCHVDSTSCLGCLLSDFERIVALRLPTHTSIFGFSSCGSWA
jgi:hypothetical protein